MRPFCHCLTSLAASGLVVAGVGVLMAQDSSSWLGWGLITAGFCLSLRTVIEAVAEDVVDYRQRKISGQKTIP